MSYPDDLNEWVDELADNRNEVDDLTQVLRNHVNDMDAAIGRWLDDEGTVEELASGLFELRTERKRLGQLEASIEASLARVMPSNEVAAGKYRLKRASGSERKNWDHEKVAGRLVTKALELTGGDLEQAVWLVRDLLLQAANPTWRTTVLRNLAVDFDDCCDVEKKRRSVQVLAVEE